MKLQTKIALDPKSSDLIDYNAKLLLLGSCFVTNIGQKLDYFKFQNLQNPFGILFNPLVIERLISRSVEERFLTEDDVFFHNELWQSYDVHSELSSTSREDYLNHLNSLIATTNKYIKESSHIIVTLGTSWVYRHIERDLVVANCHKVAQDRFSKELLSIDTISKSLEAMMSSIASINPNAIVIFTVSPVRHLKDGFVENQRSKAHLLSAIHQFLSRHSDSKKLWYFPSYEIMMDELRDYRFYAEDMVHPNKLAIDYIWEKFSQCWVSEKVKEAMNEVDAIQKGLLHKPFNMASTAYSDFIEGLEARQEALHKKYPQIRF